MCIRDSVVVPASGHQAGLDGDDHAGAEPQAAPSTALVGYPRVLVHGPPDAVAGEVVLDAVTGRAADGGHGLADIAQPRARHGLLDSGGQHALGRRDQVAVALASPADAEADRGVGMPAVDVGAAVDAQQVAVTEPVAGGQAVQHDLVHRGADHARVGSGTERRVVAEKGRSGPGLVHDLAGQLVELAQRHPDGRVRADLRVYRRDDPAGLTHHLDLAGGLELDQLLPPSRFR